MKNIAFVVFFIDPKSKRVKIQKKSNHSKKESKILLVYIYKIVYNEVDNNERC